MTVEAILGVIAPDLLVLTNYADHISMAQAQTSASFFGSNYNLAVALRAAHTWALNSGSTAGSAGIVTYKAEGRLAMSFGGTGVIRNDLELTNYGRQLKKLIENGRIPITTTAENILTTIQGA